MMYVVILSALWTLAGFDSTTMYSFALTAWSAGLFLHICML